MMHDLSHSVRIAGLLSCAALPKGPSLATTAESTGKTEFQIEPGIRQLFLDDPSRRFKAALLNVRS